MTAGPERADRRVPVESDPVRTFLRGQVAAGSMPGAAWRVEAAGLVLSSGAVGDAVVAPSREPAAPDTAYDLASLTKPLATAVLALILEGQGKPCREEKCPAGLTCIAYHGVAGPAGPRLHSCEIPCAEPGAACPGGQSCLTIADGPGRVCRPAPRP